MKSNTPDSNHCSHVERWICGFEGRYSVTVAGDVISYLRGRSVKLKGAVLKSKERGETYKVVCLTRSVDGRSRSAIHYIHRCVAEAFILNPTRKPEVNHKNGDKLENSLDNLEWMTRSENTIHAYNTGLISKSVVGKEELTSRADKFILEKDTSGLQERTVFRGLVKDDLERNHIPGDVLEISKGTGRSSNPLETWNHYINIFRLCDDKSLKLSVLSLITGYDEANLSRIRNRKVLKRAREIYEKYKDDPYYLKNYYDLY